MTGYYYVRVPLWPGGEKARAERAIEEYQVIAAGATSKDLHEGREVEDDEDKNAETGENQYIM